MIQLPYLITSLPETSNPFHSSIFSTTYKEKELDPISRENVLVNLQVIDESDCSQKVKQSLFLEQLARGLAYHMDESIKEIKLPQNGKRIPYKVEILPVATGMFAYGLTPKEENLSPILLFRGSAFYPAGRGSLATIATDLDPLGVGYTSYLLTARKITKWLEKQKQKALITGHSLGGTLATYAACDNADKVAGVEIHSTPGVSIFAKRKWDSLNNPGFKITHYYHPKDKLVQFGHARIGEHYKIDICKEKLLSQIPRYERCGWREKSIFHRVSLLGRNEPLINETPQSTLPMWQEMALTTIPCIAAYTLLGISRLLFGTAQHPLFCLLGPIRLIVRKAIHSLPFEKEPVQNLSCDSNNRASKRTFV